MAKKEQGDGFWPRMIITMVVVIWAAILGGSWIGHKIVEKQRSGATASQELNIPSPRPKPWRTADPSLQQEIEEQRQGLSRPGQAPGRTVTASPVVAPASPRAKAAPVASSPSPAASTAATPEPKPTEQPEETAPEKPSPTPVAAAPPASPKAPASPAGPPEPTPATQASSGSYQLQFGSFSKEEYARELATRLAAEGQEARIDTVQTGQGTFFRVRGGDFADESTARTQADRLRGAGIDVYVVNH